MPALPLSARAATIAVTLLLAALGPAAAQTPVEWDTGRMQLSRDDLETLLVRYESTSRSDAHSETFRTRARYEAALIRTRLREGDFQIGDQITITVEGEQGLTGDFVVNPQRGITLPVIGEIPLQGVLRAELQEHLASHLGRFIKDPAVYARSSIRILASGAIGRPGFYLVDTESLLSDALMLAGGPIPGAELTAVRIERGKERIWDGPALQQAIAEGRTLDQLSLRAGDHIVVPAEESGRMGTMARLFFAVVPALALTISTLAQIF